MVCYRNHLWTQALPTAPMGIHSTFEEDVEGTTTDFVDGQSLLLSVEFL